MGFRIVGNGLAEACPQRVANPTEIRKKKAALIQFHQPNLVKPLEAQLILVYTFTAPISLMAPLSLWLYAHSRGDLWALSAEKLSLPHTRASMRIHLPGNGGPAEAAGFPRVRTIPLT